MSEQGSFLRGLISLWLALSLLTAPLAPAFAAAQAGDASPTPHAVHENAGMHAADLHADHAKAGPAADATDHPNTSCVKHEQCSGKCCAACAQCFTAASTVSASFSIVLAVYTPIVPHLQDRLAVVPHDRPPAA